MKTGLKIILVVLGAVLITGGSIVLTSLTGSVQSVFALSSGSESAESLSQQMIAPASERSVEPSFEPSSEPSSEPVSSEPVSSKASSKTSSKKTSSKTSSAKTSSKASQVTTSVASVPSAPSTVSVMTKEERWASKMAILNDWEQFQKMLADPDNDFWDDDEFWESGEQAYTIPEPPSSSPTSSNTTSVPSYSDSERIKVMQTEKVTTRYGSTVTTDTYYNTVLRIIGAELSPSYSDECIKAQMVASYTFLRYHAGCTAVPPTAILDDLSDMKAYWKDAGMQRLYKLLAEVGGYMLFIDNHPILSTYGAINNGMTNNIVDVWGGKGIDGYGTSYTYLAGGIDCSQWDGKAKGYQTQIILSSSTVKAQLEDYFGFALGNDPSKWLVVTSSNRFGYVMSVSVDGKTTTTGKDLRGYVFTSARVGSKNSLRSTSFTVQYDAATDSFYFDVKGYGHGVGMSQEGAQQMALAGYTWQDIVKFYFPGISIV